MTSNEITIKAAEANRKPLKGWSKISGITKDQRDAVCCVATTRELNGHLLIADKDIPAVRARLGI
jgi:hypothetical protein